MYFFPLYTFLKYSYRHRCSHNLIVVFKIKISVTKQVAVVSYSYLLRTKVQVTKQYEYILYLQKFIKISVLLDTYSIYCIFIFNRIIKSFKLICTLCRQIFPKLYNTKLTTILQYNKIKLAVLAYISNINHSMKIRSYRLPLFIKYSCEIILSFSYAH